MTDFTPAPSPAENRYRISIVHASNVLLKFVADSKGPVGTAEIAKTLGISMNIAFRLCNTLEEDGMLQKVNDRYTLGFAIGLMWARIKSNLEATRDQIDRDLEKIHIPEENHG